MHGFLTSLLPVYLIFLSCSPLVNAQENDIYSDITDDSLYFYARDLAFSGNYEEARKNALFLIERNPGYYDAWVLIARVYAWEADYDSARYYITGVIDLSPGHYDAFSAFIDIEFWAGNYAGAVEIADEALVFYPGDELLLVKKARALMRELNTPGFFYFRENNYLLTGYYGEFFENPYSRHYHMGTAGYSHYNEWGPVTGRVNFANVFFDGTGYTRYPSIQYEADTYPRLNDRTYLLINYAFSRGIIFPGHRAAFEIFRSLPAGFEASGGLRYLYWDRSYFFYTGSIGKYHGDMWFSLRPYLIPREEGLSGSIYFNARRYYNSADDFAGIVIGYGLSPDTSVLPGENRIFLKSTSVGLELSKSILASFLVRTGIRYEYEEFMDNSSRNRWTFNLGLRYYL